MIIPEDTAREVDLRRALGTGQRAIATAKSWLPVLDPWPPLQAASGGALLGLLAGAYPAWRASRMQPADSIRAGGA